MPTTRYGQFTFSGGEITPRTNMRIDLEKRYQSVEILENYLVTQHGPADRRDGTIFVSQTKDNNNVRLIQFKFSTIQTYILEFGDLYMRVIKDGVQVTSGGSPFELVTPFTSAQIPDLQFAQSADTLFIAHSTHAPQRIVRLADDDWSVSAQGLDPPPSAEDSTDLATDIGYNKATGNGAIFRTNAATPWLAADVGRTIKAGAGLGTITAESGKEATVNILNAFKDNDAVGPGTASISNVSTTVTTTASHGASVGDMIIINGGASDADIRRIESITDPITFEVDANFTALDAAAAWKLHTATASGAWTIEGTPVTKCTPSVNKGPKQADVTLTLLASGWRTTLDNGKLIKINNGIAKLHTITTDKSAKGTILKVLDDLNAAESGEWTLEAESWTAAKGFPESVTLHGQRLDFAATKTFPNTIWGSANGDFSDFGAGVDDDDSFEFAMASPLVDVIQWIHPIDELFLGTIGGEFEMHGATNQPITPTSVDIDNQDDRGGAKEQPVRVGNALLFINRNRNRLIELAFNLDSDAFAAGDMNLLSDHLTETAATTLEEVAVQKEPFPIVWVIRKDGVALALTFLREQNIVGWARCIFGGAFSGGQAEAESVAVIPHWVNPVDTPFFVVKRTVNGVTVKHIEYMDDSVHTDASVKATGTDLATLAGLDHLEAETVRVVGDGGAQIDRVVASGSITIDPTADTVAAGLGYNSKMETLEPELVRGTNQTSIQGMPKRWSSFYIRFYKTATAIVNGQRVLFKDLSDIMGTGTPVFTGDKQITLRGVSREGKITIEQRDPLPQTISGYYGQLHYGDDTQ